MNGEQLLKKYKEPRYLGDGLYVTYDGYQYCLFTQEGNKVYLEPEVIFSFKDYQNEIKADIDNLSLDNPN